MISSSENSSQANGLDASRALLLSRLAAVGVVANIVAYPAHDTVEDGKRLRGEMAGTFTKNLLLRDKKGRLFLFSIHEDLTFDLRSAHQLVGASGRLGFAPPQRMMDILGVQPGALTPLGLINDLKGEVTLVIDAALMSASQINFHPMTNTESVGLTPTGLLAFVRSCGREPLLVDFQATASAGSSSLNSPAITVGAVIE